ncbi:energy transducer TonB [Flavobacterium sp.]|uniref:energy transducer TonB n=1 Tax=Flavobacterium sp. TaxID=239 RepID=UPI003F6960B3
MNLIETPEERKSFAITSGIFVIILLLCVFFGLTYMDPPPENGIAVNFGTSDVGKGDVEPAEAQQTAGQPTPSEPEVSKDNLQTQDDDSPVVAPEKIKKVTKTPPKDTKTTKPVTEPVKAETPKLNTAASNMIKGKGKTPSSGEGQGGGDGNQGQINGTIYGNSYWGDGSGTGVGNGIKAGLKGRSVKGNSKVLQECNEEGTIVVKITVNRNGQVIGTEYSASGSTSASSCLKKAAFETAKTFKWSAAPDASDKQIGFIEVKFSLGE